MEKNRICFIRAKLKKDYVYDGIKNSGFNILIPYKDKNLFLRLCREIWRKFRLPHIDIWYNNNLNKIDSDVIIVKDPLITVDFIKYLKNLHPNVRLVFDYDNRVNKSINPDLIRDYVDEIWSYDLDDCNRYNLKFKGYYYFDIYKTKPNSNPKYDVFYVGRDKGRLDQMLNFEKELNNQGLITHFYICADREFLTWKKRIYKHFLPYDQYLELLKDSRAILNIVPDGQRSITQRELEAVFDNVKCITNNKGILDFELYDPSRYFLLDNNFEEIKHFLEVPFKEVDESILQNYCFTNCIISLVEMENV